MRVAYVHHHLRPGGVTRVIMEQIGSLEGTDEALLLVGEPPRGSFPFPVLCVPSLAYDRDRKDRDSPKQIADSLLSAARQVWPTGADLYHIHNPTLGKNRDLISAIKILADRGVKLLLQIHDFAEDGRPQNYRGEGFPQDTHYAVLNKRDYNLLLAAGLREEGLHLVPNPVRRLKIPQTAVPLKDAEDAALYPVRAIRRKNIGEAVLLSLFLKPYEKVAFTLEPTGELDTRSYRDWKAFVREKNLRVRFGLGIRNAFEDILRGAAYIITTSIKEGFGFSYLEPWTIDKMLFGRLLPDICSDFIQKGLDLSHLYTSLRVPLSSIDERLFFTKWKTCYGERMKRYALSFVPERLDELLHPFIKDGCIDFGCLSEDLQRQLIMQAVESRKCMKKILDLNPFLEEIRRFKEPSLLVKRNKIVERNKRIVLEEYSSEKNRAILREVYAKVVSREVRHCIEESVVLNFFNIPEKLFLLLCDLSYD